MHRIIQYINVVFKSWILIFVAVVGFTASFMIFIPEVFLSTPSQKVFSVLICFFLSIVITIVTKPFKDVVEHIPADEIVLRNKALSKILFPYDEKYLKPINVIARTYYGNNNPDLSILKSWYEKNPLILITLADQNNTIVGYYDILPLIDSFAKDFIDGKVSEQDIRNCHILGPDQMRNANYLYFAGVAVKDYQKQRNRIYAGQLIFSAFIYLNQYYNLDREITLFAIASTKCGETILRGLDFALGNSKLNRKDKTDLYLKKISKEIVQKDRDELMLITQKLDFSNLLSKVIATKTN